MLRSTKTGSGSC